MSVFRDILNPYIGQKAPWLVVLALVCTQLGSGKESTPSEILLDLGEYKSEALPNGILSGDSLLVHPDGTFCLERRLQQRPSAPVEGKFYEASLNEMQLQQLRAILDDRRLRDLPDFIDPTIPASIYLRRGVEAKIPRGAEIQRVGYVYWRGHRPEDSFESAPEDVKKSQQRDEIALQPLMEWFHKLEGMKLHPLQIEPTQCKGT